MVKVGIKFAVTFVAESKWPGSPRSYAAWRR
jgi:hypothetical protein